MARPSAKIGADDLCHARCRGLFATHYHKLDAHLEDPTTSIRHMACHVAKDKAGREQVAITEHSTFCACSDGLHESIQRRSVTGTDARYVKLPLVIMWHQAIF